MGTFEEKSIKDLHTLDPFLHTVCNSKQFIRNRFFINVHRSVSLNLNLYFSLLVVQSTIWCCTITITRVQEGNTWWFASCNSCGKSCPQQSYAYQCSKCGCTKTSFRYSSNTQPAMLLMFYTVSTLDSISILE
jgi:hypothetical protein